tara:strand:+ start:282 stop:899 length:618 start_codon:yes stop_codon:yes gene_type:complete
MIDSVDLKFAHSCIPKIKQLFLDFSDLFPFSKSIEHCDEFEKHRQKWNEFSSNIELMNSQNKSYIINTGKNYLESLHFNLHSIIQEQELLFQNTDFIDNLSKIDTQNISDLQEVIQNKLNVLISNLNKDVSSLQALISCLENNHEKLQTHENYNKMVHVFKKMSIDSLNQAKNLPIYRGLQVIRKNEDMKHKLMISQLLAFSFSQ